MNQEQAIQQKLTAIFPMYESPMQKQRAIKQTEDLFRTLTGRLAEPKMNGLKINGPSRTKTDFTTERPVLVDQNGKVSPLWKIVLDYEMTWLENKLTTVSVVDYGAIGDGKLDCTKAFKKALSSGYRRVLVPPGKYVVRGIELPSCTELIGSGIDETVLILHKDAPKKTRLITNKHYLNGNHHIRIEGMSLDWNVARLKGHEKTASGGTFSSGITLAHVKYALVRNVKISDPGLHGIDVTSPVYNYLGDGLRARGGSEYIWIDQIEASGFGDDGITTHHSDYIFISNSYAHHPSGRAHKKGYSNSNGIEIDDGSQHVTLTNNHTAFCFGGVEIKAHETSSAASDTQIIGHFSDHDNRSYNFRHIGHHQAEESYSMSAFGIRATFLAACYPQVTKLYTASTPRALVVSAYQKVAIHHFFTITKLENRLDKIALSVQYRAGEVAIKEIRLKNYEGAKKPIRLGKETGRVYIDDGNE
ncbi:pre-neck appendage protein [Carnobacterium sp. 17-4]|uniref:glycosyl hydrolase family 28-related protein n=1 Tax=Carnobacterium sp. (strain 17-4) TaxID=208596 RepID=UPI0002058E83|nr:glycosyl hydrolase family 28-related protein [Carnobacterium sp. 17-4]AEB29067.1 pre-neck appendage protein [Carnobacterium sp. 17-4]